MVTTNDTTHQNFYVYTDDIYGEWSDPIYVDQGGIDPSLLFVDGHVYFISNGSDDDGKGGVIQCEIDIETGKKLTPGRCIWQGSGGRYLESPHMYSINGEYYLMAAEGGTEYGHMVTYARSKSVWGPFENYPKNPVLTNRNKAPEIMQGIGHGDLVQDDAGNWHILCLGFRQIHIWQTYHTLGREVFMMPVQFHEDGWFSAGNDGTGDWEYELEGDFTQERKQLYTFENTDWKIDWAFLRHPVYENYELGQNQAVLHGSSVTLNDVDTPTFIGLRQRDFNMKLEVELSLDAGEAGVTIYACEQEHYEVALRKTVAGFEVVVRLNIGGVHHEEVAVPVDGNSAKLMVRADSLTYHFYVVQQGQELRLSIGQSKYLSTEVSGGFTGVMLGLYAEGENTAVFSDFKLEYLPWEPKHWKG
jgi:alpha-N-arabinofuranosidase